MASALGQVFGMYRAPSFETPQIDAYNKRYFDNKKAEDERKRKGALIGDIARKKMGVDTDFMKINEDPEMNKPMFDPDMYDYDIDELSPNDFELAVMHDEANQDPMDTMDYYSPEETQDMQTANMYQQLAEGGYDQEVMDMMFPKKTGSLAEKQFAMQNMAQIDSQMDNLGRKYSQALRAGDKDTADSLYDQASRLYDEYGNYAFGVNQKPRAWKYFEEKPVDTNALAEQRSQEAINSARVQLNNGEITPEEYNEIYYAEKAKAKGAKGDVVNTQSEVAKEGRESAKFKLELSDAEDEIFQGGTNNLQKFKVLEAIDAYNRYLPTLESEYKSARAGRAGAQRAIVVAFNKLIEPSSAVMEGDFRSSGQNAVASTMNQLGDAGEAIVSGDYDALGRRLSEPEIDAIYASGKRIAEALRGSATKRINSEESRIQSQMAGRGFNYKPNSFVSYIGMSNDKPSGNQKKNKVLTLNEFLRAGGTRKQYKAYLKSLKG